MKKEAASSSETLVTISNFPIPVAGQSKVLMDSDLSNTGILDSNPARGMAVCKRYFVLCCPVYA
jgi:hypothetical protein